ncbi:MAG: BamA/TamA family outer membrane protein [Oligoflexia bacterium]|nr:BamA/TamA family outer membrane protein [Oligoflexia bacterium]
MKVFTLPYFAGLFFSVFIALHLPAISFAQSDSTERVLVLPLAGYSDEQGLGVGANAAWFNMLGSGWSSSAALFASTLYSQTRIDYDVYNRNFFDVVYANVGGFYNRSTRSLFYGLGNNSSLSDASQYAINDTQIFGRVGVKIFSEVVAGVGYSHRSTGIDRGADPNLQQFFDRWSTNPSLSGSVTTATSVFATYDTRTPNLAPQSGSFVFTSLEQLQPRSGQDLHQQRYTLHGQHYLPIMDKDFLILLRGRYEKQWGENIPFYLQPKLGGSTSIRALKNNRYIDSGNILFNIEPRYTLWSPGGAIFERIEISFGIDAGRVFDYENIPPRPWDSYRIGYDIGLTGILAGGIPLRIDLAPGAEGTLFYVHLFYPF